MCQKKSFVFFYEKEKKRKKSRKIRRFIVNVWTEDLQKKKKTFFYIHETPLNIPDNNTCPSPLNCISKDAQ